MNWENKIRSLSSKNRWIIVGISGATNSGKTTLCTNLVKSFDGVAINQDTYFRTEDDPTHVLVELSPTLKHQNWEMLECINWDLMCEKICEILEKPAPSHKSFLFIDGHIIFNYMPLAGVCHKKFFIDLDKETVYARRIHRTYVPPDPPVYFDKIVWPMYLSNKKAIESQDIIYIDGSQSKETIFNIVSEELQKMV